MAILTVWDLIFMGSRMVQDLMLLVFILNVFMGTYNSKLQEAETIIYWKTLMGQVCDRW